MLRISRVDEVLAGLAKPQLSAVDALDISADDCLIVCAGFEDRALAFLRNATSRGGQHFRVLVIHYLPAVIQNRTIDIDEICRHSGLPQSGVTYDRRDPTGLGDAFLAELGSLGGRVYVDVSGMSRLLIVQLLVALRSRNSGFSRCSILYAEAAEYPPSRAEVEHAIAKSGADPLYSIMLLSSGVFEVTIVPELSSLSPASQQTRLVAFPSFNTDQLTAIRTELQPSRYSIIHGLPPAAEHRWRTEAIARLNHTDNLEAEESYFTSTLDYRETLNRLLEIYAKHGATERMLIAPTGSKMQAVAVGILKSFLSDVQIVYPTPRTFTSPAAYTIGVKRLYTLPLDSFSQASAA